MVSCRKNSLSPPRKYTTPDSVPQDAKTESSGTSNIANIAALALMDMHEDEEGGEHDCEVPQDSRGGGGGGPAAPAASQGASNGVYQNTLPGDLAPGSTGTAHSGSGSSHAIVVSGRHRPYENVGATESAT